MPFQENAVTPVPERGNDSTRSVFSLSGTEVTPFSTKRTPSPLPEKSEFGRGPMFHPSAKTHSCRESPFTTLSIAFRSP
jgi:hypothetical protein